jgi:hypothetical protein
MFVDNEAQVEILAVCTAVGIPSTPASPTSSTRRQGVSHSDPALHNRLVIVNKYFVTTGGTVDS